MEARCYEWRKEVLWMVVSLPSQNENKGEELIVLVVADFRDAILTMQS